MTFSLARLPGCPVSGHSLLIQSRILRTNRFSGNGTTVLVLPACVAAIATPLTGEPSPYREICGTAVESEASGGQFSTSNLTDSKRSAQS